LSELSHFPQHYTKEFCNCSVAFFYPAVNYRECNVSSLICLIEHNDFLNAEKPQMKNEFFDDDDDGMVCKCLPECSRIDYSFEVSPIYDEKKISANLVMLDVHYASKTMMKYRTDATFSGMDLIVGFGGIVSLFLGCSVLSGVEIIYFATIAMFWHRKRNKTTRDEIIGKIKARFPFLN
jgi:amiloride-sensitive sodium channel